MMMMLGREFEFRISSFDISIHQININIKYIKGKKDIIYKI